MSKYLSPFLLLGVLLLAGCSLLQSKPEPESDWAFKGKMAVQNSSQSSSFNISWLQQNQNYQIKLSGPLGQGGATIKGEPGLVVMIQGDRLLYSDTLSNLVAENTNLDLPLDYLQYWVRALPSPLEAYETVTGESGQTSKIVQSGWSVSIDSYFSDQQDLPRKLSFAKAEQSGKLVIREWSQKPEATY